MQQDTVNGLVELRQAILREIGPLLADSNEMSVPERFAIYLRLAHEQGGAEYYGKALDLLRNNGEVEDKLSLYLDLLGDVDYEINAAANAAPNQVEEKASTTQPDESQ